MTRKVTVEIYCAAPSHARRRVIISVFERRASGSRFADAMELVSKAPGLVGLMAQNLGGDWTESGVTTRGVFHLDKHTAEALDPHDQLVPSAEEEQPVSQRSRYRLHCKLCGVNVEARAENLHPLLDALAANDVSTVSLSGIAPRLL